MEDFDREKKCFIQFLSIEKLPSRLCIHVFLNTQFMLYGNIQTLATPPRSGLQSISESDSEILRAATTTKVNIVYGLSKYQTYVNTVTKSWIWDNITSLHMWRT